MAAPLDVEDVISKLTLDEKISLLSGKNFWATRDIPRLNIPSLNFSDGPNGVRGRKFFNGVPSNCFPCGTGLAASWDPELIERAGRMLGSEAIAKGAHVSLGPTINISRGPLGGRGFESYGEDPLLSGMLAAAMVRGVQSTGVAACIKHFVCNDMEHERQAVNCVVTERALREIYLMPFMIAQRDSSPMAYMTSYNKLNGLHVSENKRIMQVILREEWGFNGFIMSDWFGTYSAAESVNAGLDIEMPGPPRMRGPNVLVSVGNRKVTERTLDERIRNLLNLANKTAPLGIDSDAEEKVRDTPETRQLMRELAVAGLTLLKNEKQVLPLDKSKTVAVIGPNAKFAAYSGGGSASLPATYTTTPFEGITQHQPDAKYTLGATGYFQLPAISMMSTREDGKPGVTCKFFNEPHDSKERICRDTIHTPLSDMLLVDYAHPDVSGAIFYMDMTATITPDQSGEYDFGCSVRGTARVFIDGELIVDNATKQRQGGTFLGAGTMEERGRKHLEAGKTYSVLLQFGSAQTQTIKKKGATAMRGGGVRLGCAVVTDPKTEIEKAVALAKECDQVVVCAGLTGEWESEGFDRQHMDLPGHMDEMIAAVAAANPKTVVVVQCGTPVAMPWVDQVAGVLHSSYGGNEGGNAIGDVLFGEAEPSGRLPITFPRRVEDNPTFLNHRSENGRCLYGEDVYVGYRYYDKTKVEPLFPFGHGLSYTKFEVRGLGVRLTGDTVSVDVELGNTESRAGAVVAQVYVNQLKSTIGRPLKELKGFKKASLASGETKQVLVDIPLKYAASCWDEEADSWVMEAGDYEVLVGQSSASTDVVGTFHVDRTSWWRGL